MPYLSTVTLDELVSAVRRQSQGFARGTSTYRGVTRHPNGRWEARLGVPGSKHVYLGLFESETARGARFISSGNLRSTHAFSSLPSLQEAARAYDRALVRLRGASATTNFSTSECVSMKHFTQRAHDAQSLAFLFPSSYAAEIAAYDATDAAGENLLAAPTAPLLLQAGVGPDPAAAAAAAEAAAAAAGMPSAGSDASAPASHEGAAAAGAAAATTAAAAAAAAADAVLSNAARVDARTAAAAAVAPPAEDSAERGAAFVASVWGAPVETAASQ